MAQKSPQSSVTNSIIFFFVISTPSVGVTAKPLGIFVLLMSQNEIIVLVSSLLVAHRDLALYRDLADPHVHKYAPLFLPSCARRLGQEVGLFWVSCVNSRKSRAFRTVLNRTHYALPPVVTCHGGILLKAA